MTNEEAKEMCASLMKGLTPEQTDELTQRLDKRSTPVDQSETQWQPGDYVTFKNGRRWIIARVLGFHRVCSEMFEVLVVEPTGFVGGVRYGGRSMKLLERVPPDQAPACEDYWHTRPVGDLKPEDTHFKCLGCRERVPVTPEIRTKNEEFYQDIHAKVDALIAREQKASETNHN